MTSCNLSNKQKMEHNFTKNLCCTLWSYPWLYKKPHVRYRIFRAAVWRYEVRPCRLWALHLEHCTAPGQDRHRGGRAGRVLGAPQFRSNPYGENISSSSRMFWPAAAAALSLALSGQYHYQHRIPQVVTNTDTRRWVPSGWAWSPGFQDIIWCMLHYDALHCIVL